MRRTETVPMGIRATAAYVKRLTAEDETLRGTYWYDLNARRPAAAAVKRAIDVVVALAAIALTAPLLLVLAIVQGGFTTERRLGFRGHTFDLHRFRRGRFQALPQLWNVLEGTMSLVGPRALPECEVNRAMRRFSVRPGITGPRTTCDERRYINEWSLALDLRMLLHSRGSSMPPSPGRE
jgi:lipopolysaccharide/colanic/teichoic acid biosynthesis glycosyltransferase